jgi:hypothetical protein
METLEYRGITINIEPEGVRAESPRKMFDNIGTMICFHDRHELGDDHEFSDHSDVMQYLQEQGDKVIWCPLYLYEHGGITMNTVPFSCQWDSGQVGIIYAESEKIYKIIDNWTTDFKNEFYPGMSDSEIALEILKQEVETYDHYLTGSVYGYSIEENDDSCWGFYGDNHEESGLLEMAKNSIDSYLIGKAIKEHNKRIERSKTLKADRAFKKRKKALRMV